MTIHIDLSNIGNGDPFSDEVLIAMAKSITLWSQGRLTDIESIDPSITVSVDTSEELSAGTAVESTETKDGDK